MAEKDPVAVQVSPIASCPESCQESTVPIIDPVANPLPLESNSPVIAIRDSKVKGAFTLPSAVIVPEMFMVVNSSPTLESESKDVEPVKLDSV